MHSATVIAVAANANSQFLNSIPLLIVRSCLASPEPDRFTQFIPAGGTFGKEFESKCRF
jgi:hypothetical protein